MKYLLLVVLLFSSGQARATRNVFLVGNKLLEVCEAHISETGSAAKGNICVGYITGISDAQGLFVDWRGIKPSWCLPLEATSNQLVRVVTKYLQEHPEYLHLTADGLIGNALKASFPCE